MEVDELAVWARPDDQQPRAQPEGWPHTLSACEAALKILGRKRGDWGKGRDGEEGGTSNRTGALGHVTARVTVIDVRNVVLTIRGKMDFIDSSF